MSAITVRASLNYRALTNVNEAIAVGSSSEFCQATALIV
jgi:hypothetical protein